MASRMLDYRRFSFHDHSAIKFEAEVQENADLCTTTLISVQKITVFHNGGTRKLRFMYHLFFQRKENSDAKIEKEAGV